VCGHITNQKPKNHHKGSCVGFNLSPGATQEFACYINIISFCHVLSVLVDRPKITSVCVLRLAERLDSVCGILRFGRTCDVPVFTGCIVDFLVPYGTRNQEWLEKSHMSFRVF